MAEVRASRALERGLRRAGARRVRGLLGLVGALAAGVGCKPAGPEPGGATIDCNGIERVTLDCRAEFSYEGIEASADVDIASWFGTSAELAETSIRAVDRQVEQYSAMHGRLCRDYNACIVDPQQYREESGKIRAHLTEMPALLDALQKASNAEERMAILDRIVARVVPEEGAASEELTFQLAVHGQAPGGPPKIVRVGESLPTGSALYFSVRASTDAYVYMFQVAGDGAVTVLFPEPRIGTTNPLKGGVAKRIPDMDQSFTITGEPGTERVFFVVSRDPVDSLERALAQARGSSSFRVADDEVLATIASVRPEASASKCPRVLELNAGPPTGCAKPRAITLTPSDGAAGAVAEPSTLAVQSRPGDDTIVQVFELTHVAP